jgi:hypothetical protein
MEHCDGTVVSLAAKVMASKMQRSGVILMDRAMNLPPLHVWVAARRLLANYSCRKRENSP